MANYTLDTGKKYIKDIFASDCFYNIPEYQRPFVWGEEQISALLEDIDNAMGSDKRKEYFLGCMIWNTKKVKDGDIEYLCHDILDGQQRFITIYILQGVMRDLSYNTSLITKVNERMRQEEDEFDGIPERHRIIFQIRTDKEFIDKFLIQDKGTLQVPDSTELHKHIEVTVSTRNMANAVRTIKNWFLDKKEQLEEEGNFQKYLSDYYTYLSSKVLALFLATSDNLDDAYNLFTVLNSRGLQLQSSDILRAQNLRVIQNEDQRKKYASKWEDYENSISSPYKSFDEFLWSIVYIVMKYRSDSNQSLSKAFSFMYDKNLLEKGTQTFEFVGRYVKHLEAVTTNSYQQDEAGLVFSNLNYILTSTFGNIYITPLMHYRECFGEYRILDFMIKLDNLFSASWLVDNRNLQSRVFIMLRKMDELCKINNNIQDAADVFLVSQILDYGYQDEKASTAIEIDKLFDLLDTEKWGSFSGTRINKTRYILLKMDLFIGSLHTQLYFNKLMSSIEHIMPQKIENTEWLISEEQHKLWLHRLGNIVLIDRRKNASLSNLPYNSKKSKYQSAIENRANTNRIFMMYSEWDIESIVANHNINLSLLKEYYLGNSLKTFKEIKKKLSSTQYYNNNKVY